MLSPTQRSLMPSGVKADTIGKVLRGGRSVTASLAYRVARLTDVSIDDLLAGALLSVRTCSYCGGPAGRRCQRGDRAINTALHGIAPAARSRFAHGSFQSEAWRSRRAMRRS